MRDATCFWLRTRLECAVKQGPQHRENKRFLDIPVSAGLDGFYHAFVGAAAGDDDGGDVLNFVVQLTQQLEPVHPGQFDINQHHIGSEFRELCEGFFAAGNAQYLEIQFAKVGFVTLPGVVFVLDNQYALRLILWWHRSIEPNSSFTEIQADARWA